MRFGILIILLTASIAAVATEVTPKSIRYACHSREALDRAKELTRKVIDEAVTEFGRINPAIRDRLVSRLRSRKLLVSCGSASWLDRHEAQAVSQGRTFKSYKITVRADDLMKMPEEDIKYVLLHELLHYAKVDNLSTRKHNEVYRTDPTQDNVYSCAYVLYPSWRYPMNYGAALRTCETATLKR